MKLVAQVKLLPDAEQRAALLRTLEAANAACDFVSAHAWRTRTFGQFDLHRAAYRAVRERFGLGADIAVRVFAKVADAYKLDRRTQRTFAPRGAFPFNDRLVSYNLGASTISIWTLAGRQKIAFVCGARQRDLLAGLRGECDLVYRKGEFYLFQTCNVETSAEIVPVDFLGVDLGIVNIATDSDGRVHQGRTVENVRFRQRRLRAKLQRKGTKSSRRLLKRLSGKEHRFATDVNHCISKQLAQSAKDTGRGLALEDLTGIRDRVTARRSQRARLHSWSFHQLCAFIAYKAQRAGVPVVLVDPRNTSRTCPACGHIDKANRPTQSKFSCVRCGFAGLADHIAAENIRRAAVVPPNVSTPLRVSESTAVRQGQS